MLSPEYPGSFREKRFRQYLFFRVSLRSKYFANTIGGLGNGDRRERRSQAVLRGKVWWPHTSHTTLPYLLCSGPFPLATAEEALVPVLNSPRHVWLVEPSGHLIRPGQIRVSPTWERSMAGPGGLLGHKTVKPILEKIYITGWIQ